MKFYCSTETAHMLTKVAKKNGYHYHALTRTTDIERVYCYGSAAMMDYIKENGIEVEIDENPNLISRQHIGKRIAELRKEKGMTQKDLADATGLNQPNIARIEGGKYSTSLDLLARIADALGKKIDIV